MVSAKRGLSGRRRRCATRANHRGDGAARGRRADHGDRVSIMSQQVTFYDADGWILRAPVDGRISLTPEACLELRQGLQASSFLAR
jgi:hypothetical protein